MQSAISYKTIYVYDGKIILYRCGAFYLAEGSKITLIVKLPLSLFKSSASRLRITNRLLRLEPRAVEQLSQNKFVFCFDHKIWILDVDQKETRVICENRMGWSDPLNFCSNGAGVYWGEYGSNDERDEVKVYQMTPDERINEVYSFPPKSVRHIHNIIFDEKKDEFWIFTGDNDAKAGIYKASKDWKYIEPIRVGEQRFRAVVGFPSANGLIYATDSVMDINHIYLLLNDGKQEDLATINGSCIYGTETRDYYVFSTTVESPEGRSIMSLFSYKLGEGILSREVQVVAVRKSDFAIKTIALFNKDLLPLKLFQYGAVMFPQRKPIDNALWMYVMACKKFDGKSLLIDINIK